MKAYLPRGAQKVVHAHGEPSREKILPDPVGYPRVAPSSFRKPATKWHGIHNRHHRRMLEALCGELVFGRSVSIAINCNSCISRNYMFPTMQCAISGWLGPFSACSGALCGMTKGYAECGERYTARVFTFRVASHKGRSLQSNAELRLAGIEYCIWFSCCWKCFASTTQDPPVFLPHLSHYSLSQKFNILPNLTQNL